MRAGSQGYLVSSSSADPGSFWSHASGSLENNAYSVTSEYHFFRMSEIENFNFDEIFDENTVKVKKDFVDVKFILGKKGRNLNCFFRRSMAPSTMGDVPLQVCKMTSTKSLPRIDQVPANALFLPFWRWRIARVLSCAARDLSSSARG